MCLFYFLPIGDTLGNKISEFPDLVELYSSRGDRE